MIKNFRTDLGRMPGILAAMIAAVMMIAGTTANAQDVKAGFVYVGPVGDHGWTYRHDKGRQAVENELGVSATYVESVPEGADAERVEAAIRGLEPAIEGTALHVEGGFGRPAMERTPANRRLWAVARKLGAELGLELEQPELLMDS